MKKNKCTISKKCEHKNELIEFYACKVKQYKRILVFLVLLFVVIVIICFSNFIKFTQIYTEVMGDVSDSIGRLAKTSVDNPAFVSFLQLATDFSENYVSKVVEFNSNILTLILSVFGVALMPLISNIYKEKNKIEEKLLLEKIKKKEEKKSTLSTSFATGADTQN